MTPAGLLQLKSDEGYRQFVYDDKTGMPIKKSNSGYLTIGYGRNLQTRGLTVAEATFLLNNDIETMWANIAKLMPWVNGIFAIWQDVILMVEYNTGNVFAFTDMLNAMKNNNAQSAEEALMNSEAARSLPDRYNRMALAILDNAWLHSTDSV